MYNIILLAIPTQILFITVIDSDKMSMFIKSRKHNSDYFIYAEIV